MPSFHSSDADDADNADFIRLLAMPVGDGRWLETLNFEPHQLLFVEGEYKHCPLPMVVVKCQITAVLSHDLSAQTQSYS